MMHDDERIGLPHLTPFQWITFALILGGWIYQLGWQRSDLQHQAKQLEALTAINAALTAVPTGRLYLIERQLDHGDTEIENLKEEVVALRVSHEANLEVIRAVARRLGIDPYPDGPTP